MNWYRSYFPDKKETGIVCDLGTIRIKCQFLFYVKNNYFFREGYWCAGKETGSYKSPLPCIKWLTIYQIHHVPLRLTQMR